MKRLRAFWLLQCISLLVFVSTLQAQTTSATVSGLVLDSSGAIVIGASVQAINDDTNVAFPTSTNREGVYALPNLPPGHYRMQVSMTGFRTIIKPDIVLNVQDARAINFTLLVGATSEVVTVEGGVSPVETQNPGVSTVVPRGLVDNLPLNGRSFQALINLTPGVVLTAASFALPGQFSINGQRSDSNYFSVDGVSANVAASPGIPLTQYGAGVYPAFSASGGTNSLVSIEALEEFRVQSSTFAPEYGRTPGGQVSISTRSGANQFHGTAFEYFRNDILDANDWFANHAGVNKSPLRQNDFGGVFSGPIVRDKLFFFYSYEGLRLRLPQTMTVEVPSMDFRNNASPAMQPVLAQFPIPNGQLRPNGLQDFTGSFSNPSSLDATSLRIDYNPSKRWTVFGRYNYAPSSSDIRGDVQQNIPPNQTTHFNTNTQTATFGVTTAVNPRLANEFRFNYSHVSAHSFDTVDNLGGAVSISSSTVFPSPITFANGLYDLDLNFISFPNCLLEVGPLSNNLQRQFNFVDNVSYSRGAHLVKFGVDYRRLSPVQHPASYSQIVGLADEASAQAGNAGIIEVFSTQPSINFIYKNLSFFVQDTWKLTRRLTLTYGLRWDYNPVPSNGSGTPPPYTLSGLNTQSLNPANLTSVAPVGTPLYSSSHSDFAPRAGFAYQLRDSARWTSVIRAGFGRFNNISNTVFGDTSFGFPYTAENIIFGTSYPPNPAVVAPPPLGVVQYPIGRILVPDPQLKSPYSLQWNAALEQQLGGPQSLSLSYVGSVSRRLIYQDQFSSPNPNFGSIWVSLNGANSSYNALQAQFRRQMTHGLQALASYTWSHAIDMDSNTEGSVALGRGNADFDIRHAFTLGAAYELPKPHWGKFVDTLLKNWTLDSSLYARSGAPFDVIGSFVFAPAFFEARPNVVPGQPFYISDPSVPGGVRLNSAAFTPAAPNQQGDLPRNFFRGMGAWQLDSAMRRDIHLTERFTLQVRGEMFNIFNHPNFGPPDHFLGTPTFGAPTQTLAQSLGSGGVQGGFNPLYQIGGPRSIQLALKLQF